MFAHVEALVGGIDHQGVLQQSGLLQIVEQAAHIVVDRLRYLGVLAHIALELKLGQFLSLQIALVELVGNRVVEAIPSLLVGFVHAAHHIQVAAGEGRGLALLIEVQVVDGVHILKDTHLLFGSGAAVGIVIIEIGRDFKGLVFVLIEVLHFRHPDAVAGLVMHKDGKGLVLVALVLQPVDAHVGN